MPLRFYNSLTRQIEPFVPQEPGVARVYHCGPTVYQRPHLGNMRRFLFADFLHRTLEFFGYTVQEVTNITDVGHLTQDDIDAGEDKLERAARAEHRTPQDIAQRVTKQFFADLSTLHIKPSNHYPPASEHIAAMQKLITQLLERGHAYQTTSGVYFHVPSFPAYGKLSGNTVVDLAAGKRVDVREEKRHPADFALWKTGDPEHLQQWDSPWGRGYPGWHIECSAMASVYLGTTLDIHTGGEDLKFPHHENEIAQSEGAFQQPFARFWLHNGMLKLAGTKLAKRDGASLTVDTLHERDYSPLAFRLLAFASNYRSPLEFSWTAMDQATANLASVNSLVQRLQEVLPYSPAFAENEPNQDFVDRFGTALADDLNTPAALASVLEYIRELNSRLAAGAIMESEARAAWATLLRMDAVLGVITPLLAETAEVPPGLKRLAEERETAREQRDFAQADVLREQIAAAGWRVEDTPQGPRLTKA